MAHKIFTIESGRVAEGVALGRMTVNGFAVPVIEIGESGRGRTLARVPVELLPATRKQFDDGDVVRVAAASLATTRNGGPKLVEAAASTDDTHVLCVFRTHIGFRGGNDHTGDRTPGCSDNGETLSWLPFPGQIVAKGCIAQGDAGRMGGGDQLVALMPKDVVFRTGYSGRLYGAPSAHYYKWTDDKLLVATWADRVATDLF